MVNIPSFTRFYTSQVVQDSFLQQYDLISKPLVGCWPAIFAAQRSRKHYASLRQLLDMSNHNATTVQCCDPPSSKQRLARFVAVSRHLVGDPYK